MTTTTKADGTVLINTKINTDGFAAGASDLKSKFSNLGSSIKKLSGIIFSVFSVTAIANFAKDAIELGSDLQEVQNVVDVTFTSMSQKVNEFAQNAAASAGLSETMAKKYMGTFGAMAKMFKFTEAESYNMAEALTQLTGDVASFYNLTQDAAYTKLKSVFTGETESLKDLGVVMTQTALDDFAMRNGFGKTTKTMSEQEKVALRYKFVMEQLQSASGDFIRTSDGWANQTRILSLQFGQLKATIGQGLINVLTPVLKMINTLLAKLQTLAAAFKSFTEALFGKASNGSGGVSGGYDNATESAENFGQAATAAGKAAKKSLAGFDEITAIQDKASGSGGADDFGGAAGSSAPNYDLGLDSAVEIDEKIIKAVEKFKKALEPLQKIDFTKVSKSMEGFNEAAKKLSSTIGEHLGKAYEDVLVPLAEWTIEDLAPTSVDALTSAFEFLDASADTAGDAVFAFYNQTKPIWTYLGDVATGTIEKLGNSFSRFAETIEEKNPRITQAFDDLGYVVGKAYKIVEPLLIELKELFEFNLGAIGLAMDKMLETGIDAFADLASFIRNVFSGDFEGALAAVKQGLNNWIRGSLETLNVVLMSIAVGLNKILVKLNAIKLKIPDWVPEYGGKSFGILDLTGGLINPANWQIPIPQLASGAVIPPNAPFLAMLGDQRHGTNIEAPLSTIQDAFRAEVGEMVGGMMAGFQASLDVQEQILAAILGIEIGDTTIGEAAARYAAAQRMIRGG